MAAKPSMGAALNRVKELAAQRAQGTGDMAVVANDAASAEMGASSPPVEVLQASSADPKPAVTHVVEKSARDSESTSARAHVSTSSKRAPDVPKGFNVRPRRVEKPHQSVYAHPQVFKVLRQIASQEDIKPQDLYREGLRAVLKARGYDFDKLDKGEV